MNKDDKKIVLELNEHDASRLLTLINREMRQSDKIWQPYWEHLAQSIRQSMERVSSFNRSTPFRDMFSR